MPVHQATKQRDLPAYCCNSVEEMLQMYLTCNTFNSTSRVITAKAGVSVKTPFPNIFDPSIDKDGYIASDERPDNIGMYSTLFLL